MNELSITQFDRFQFFSDALEKNLIAQENMFRFYTVDGLYGMDQVINSMRDKTSFFCVDTSEDSIITSSSMLFDIRKICSVYIMKRFTIGKVEEQKKALAVCRKIYTQMISKLIRDHNALKDQLCFFDFTRIVFKEFEGYPINGCTGGYFFLNYAQPIDLTFKENEWIK